MRELAGKKKKKNPNCHWHQKSFVRGNSYQRIAKQLVSLLSITSTCHLEAVAAASEAEAVEAVFEVSQDYTHGLAANFCDDLERITKIVPISRLC